MTVVIDLGYVQARIDKGVWECEDSVILTELKLMQDERIIYTSDPDPDFTLAKEAAKEFDGAIIRHDKIPRKKGLVY
jgi:hypothetical protein